MTNRPNPIGLASGVLVGFEAEVVIGAAAHAGFDSAGLWIEPDDWPSRRCAAIRRQVADDGISLVDIEVLRLPGGPLTDDARRMIGIAAELGAPNLLVVGNEPDEAAFVDAYAALCEHGAAHGVRIALEFMLFSSVRTLDSAWRIVAAARSPAAALLIDPLHLDRAGGSPADVASLPRDLLPYAQFCDASRAHVTSQDHVALLDEARDDRLQPGEGVLPLIDLLRALPPATPLSLEVRSAVLRDRYPDPIDRTLAVRQATDRFLATAQVAA